MKPLLVLLCLCAPALSLQEPQDASGDRAGRPTDAAGRRDATSQRRPGARNRTTNLSRAVLEDYFEVGDYDSNGFITFREARKSLAITRAGFAKYDLDRNGMIDIEEFAERYNGALLEGDSLPEPIPDRGAPKPPTRNGAQLRLAFDANSDGHLDLEEVQVVLTTYDREEIDAKDTLERLDIDDSGVLELSELDGLAPLLFAKDSLGLVEVEDDEEPERPRRSILTVADLFGERKVRKSATNAAPLPPRIQGPLDHFSRLDYDEDGSVSFEDLDALIRPIQSSIRLNAVVATLDTDGDGVVSHDEFISSMQD